MDKGKTRSREMYFKVCVCHSLNWLITGGNRWQSFQVINFQVPRAIFAYKFHRLQHADDLLVHDVAAGTHSETTTPDYVAQYKGIDEK